jgi:hypothetical protein
MNNLPNRTGRSLEENARTATDAFGRMQETILNPDGSTPTLANIINNPRYIGLRV